MAPRKKKKGTSLVGVTEQVAKNLQKMYKNSSLTIQHGLDKDSSANVTHWIPTGCRTLDLAISNLPDVGGFPCGRLTIMYGPEQSGKSLLAMHAIANTQKMGGQAVYIDAEFSIHEAFASAIGVDLTTVDYMASNEAEKIFSLIESYCMVFRKENPDRLLTIVLDSIASLLTEDNIKNGHDIKGYDTSLSRLLSSSFRILAAVAKKCNVALIFTNQARYKMNLMNPRENPWKAFGGQAAPHYASVILFMEKSGVIKGKVNGVERPVGRHARAKVVKNRLAAPDTKVEFDIYFDRGIDDHISWMKLVKAFGTRVVFDGAWINYEALDGRVFKENGWIKFSKNVLDVYPEIADEIWLNMTEKYIQTYANLGDDVEIIMDDESTETDGEG